MNEIIFVDEDSRWISYKLTDLKMSKFNLYLSGSTIQGAQPTTFSSLPVIVKLKLENEKHSESMWHGEQVYGVR